VRRRRREEWVEEENERPLREASVRERHDREHDETTGGASRRCVPGRAALLGAAVALTAAALGCGGLERPSEGREGDVSPPLPYAASVVDFSPGEGAGFGGDRFPGVVLGPPKGAGEGRGSFDVLSLGAGGAITLAFGDRAIEDGPGADFIVYENAFYRAGDSGEVAKELGEVSVSRDGENWRTFPCDEEPESPGKWPGCAGWNPVLEYDAEEVSPPDPEVTGGDPFDLSEVGLEGARFVRIRDRSGEGFAPKAGFDLDAVGIANPTVE